MCHLTLTCVPLECPVRLWWCRGWRRGVLWPGVPPVCQNTVCSLRAQSSAVRSPWLILSSHLVALNGSLPRPTGASLLPGPGSCVQGGAGEMSLLPVSGPAIPSAAPAPPAAAPGLLCQVGGAGLLPAHATKSVSGAVGGSVLAPEAQTAQVALPACPSRVPTQAPHAGPGSPPPGSHSPRLQVPWRGPLCPVPMSRRPVPHFKPSPAVTGFSLGERAWRVGRVASSPGTRMNRAPEPPMGHGLPSHWTGLSRCCPPAAGVCDPVKQTAARARPPCQADLGTSVLTAASSRTRHVQEVTGFKPTPGPGMSRTRMGMWSLGAILLVTDG